MARLILLAPLAGWSAPLDEVPDAVFEAVRGHFDETGLVELTATIAAYNMVSRFLEALQVHSDDAR